MSRQTARKRDDRVMHLEIAGFFTLRAGRILLHRSFFDSFEFVQQLLGRDLTDAFAAGVRDTMLERGDRFATPRK